MEGERVHLTMDSDVFRRAGKISHSFLIKIGWTTRVVIDENMLCSQNPLHFLRRKSFECFVVQDLNA